jgi:signal transduction histidine kinase
MHIPEHDLTSKPLQRIQYRGFIVAFGGFGITRLFVAEALQADGALPFLIAGLLPLVLGLLLTVYGVALAVGPFNSTYVTEVARWHVLGIGTMVVIFLITAADQFLRGSGLGFEYEAPLLVANVLLGGAIGGTVIGIRSGRNIRQQREIRRSANRARLVNRLLRHEVLNAATIVDGHTNLLNEHDGSRPESVSAIRRAVHRIQSTVEKVGTIAENGDRAKRVDAETIISEEINDLESEYGIDVQLSVATTDNELKVDYRLGLVVRELLENAVVYGEESHVEVYLEETPHTLELSVTDDGPGLSETQRLLLEDGDFPEFDDPAAGFGLQIVRLLVVQVGGEIRVRNSPGGGTGTRITVRLPLNEQSTVTSETISLSFPNLERAVVAGVLGGVAMGVFYQLSTGLLPVIGSLYGVESPLIGWITHLFHSVVFGLLFATLCTEPRLNRFVSGGVSSGLLGLGWGIVLWFVAAGMIMPAWFTLIGIPSAIPNLSLIGFVGHAIWGVVLGVAYWKIKTVQPSEYVRWRS